MGHETQDTLGTFPPSYNTDPHIVLCYIIIQHGSSELYTCTDVTQPAEEHILSGCAMKILLWWTSAQSLHYFRNFKNKPDNNNKLDNNSNIIIITIMTATMVFCDCRTALGKHVFTDGKVA